MTLTDIYESRLDKEGNKGPLYPFDETTKEKTDTVTGSWYLEADLYISDGSKLVVQGESVSCVEHSCISIYFFLQPRLFNVTTTHTHRPNEHGQSNPRFVHSREVRKTFPT